MYELGQELEPLGGTNSLVENLNDWAEDFATPVIQVSHDFATPLRT